MEVRKGVEKKYVKGWEKLSRGGGTGFFFERNHPQVTKGKSAQPGVQVGGIPDKDRRGRRGG